MIRINNLNKYFNHKKENEVHVINNMTLKFPETGLVAILGASGSGKSTLLNSICGIDKTESGYIEIDNICINKYRMKQFDDIRNMYFGFIFQNYNLISDLTVYENVALSLRMIGLKNEDEISEKVLRALEIVKMERFKNRKANFLSGGEQQRVAIARAIVKDCKYILADEPTGNLDLKNTITIMRILEELSKSRLVVMVTHEKELAYSYADKIIQIVDGRIEKYEDNDKSKKFNFIDENEIYLDELKENNIVNNQGMNISLYGDVPENLDLSIKFVVVNGRLFIQTRSKNQSIRIVDDNSLVQFKTNREIIAEEPIVNVIKVDPSKFKPSSNISFWTYFKKGFNDIFKLKPIKKFLFIIFLFASLLLTVSIGIYRASSSPDEKLFMQNNRDMISVNLYNIDNYDEAYERFIEIIGYDDIYGYTLGVNNITLSLVNYYDYYYGYCDVFNNTPLIPYTEVQNYTAVIPKVGEIVLDRLVIENICKNNPFICQLLANDSMIIGQEITVGDNSYKVVGITETNTISMFINPKDELFSHYQSSVSRFQALKYEEVVTSDLNPGQGKILVSKNSNYKLGEKLKFLNNKEYEVVGKFSYSNELQELSNLYYVFNEADLLEQLFVSSLNILNPRFSILSRNPENTLSIINEKENIEAVSLYETDKDTYYDEWRLVSRILLIISAISFFVPLIMLYFLMKSNMISRIKEIGIYRALGMRRLNIVKMNLGEVLAITILFSIPGYLLGLLLMNNIPNVQVVFFKIDAFVIVVTFMLIVLINLVIGLLPIGLLLRKTPQEILIKYDI